MKHDDIPFRRIVRIVNEAAEGRKAEQTNFTKVSVITKLVEKTMYDILDEEEQQKLQFIRPDREYKEHYESIRRLALQKTVKDLAYGSRQMDNARELCRLLKKAIESNVSELFVNKDKSAEAVKKIDEEWKNLKAMVKKLKHPESITIEKSKATKGGSSIVNVMKKRNALNSVYGALYNKLYNNKTEKSGIPDFVEDYLHDEIWEDEYEELIVVRKSAEFLFKGEDRVVAFAILETPVTHNVHVIRLGSDYWLDAEDVYDFEEAAFYFSSDYASITDAIAELMGAINTDGDLEIGLTEENSASGYDTYDTLNEKLSALLA